MKGPSKEFIVTVVVAFVAAAVLLIGIRGVKSSAPHEAKPYRDIETIRNALEEYRIDRATYPTGTQEEIFKSIRTFCDSMPRGYSTNGAALDPWATPYRITTTGTNIEVRSAGPDRKFGTADDIAAP